MKNRIFLMTLLIGLSNLSFAQQDIQMSQVLSNPYLFNPAAGGLMNVGEITIGNRMQWVNVEGKPSTFYATASSQIKFKKQGKAVLNEMTQADKAKNFFSTPQRTIGKKHILGATLISDQIGPFQKSSVRGSYAYHLPLSSKLNAGVGLGLGWSNFGINESKVFLQSAGDNTYLSYVGTTSKQNFVDVSSGLVIYSDRFLFSLAASQLTKTQVRLSDVETENNYVRHLYILTSYRFDAGKNIGIEPLAVLKKTGNTPLSYELGVRAHYQNMGWFGLSYRKQSAISLGVGVNLLAHFRVSYSYDIGVQATRGFGSGTHELQLGFIFGHKRNLKKEFKKDEKEAEKETI